MLLRRLTTLVFLRNENKILLGLRKCGFGEDKWNGIGGKVQPNEPIVDAAVRSLKEKCGVDVKPSDLQNIAHLEFTFKGEPLLMEVRVFSTNVYEGTPIETEKIRPRWFTTDNIPYKDMWPDDAIWFPYMLQNKKFLGRFHYDNLDTILNQYIEEQASMETYYENLALLS